VQADPIKPTLKPTGTKRLKLKCDILLSTSAFKYNLRRYNGADGHHVTNVILSPGGSVSSWLIRYT